MEGHPRQVDPLVGGSVVPLVDEPAMFAVEAMLGGELGAAAIAESWQVGRFESVSIPDVVGEFLGAEDGAIPVC